MKTVDNRVQELQDEVATLQRQIEGTKLLIAIWNELGPYTDALPGHLRGRLQDYFNFDDSE